MTFQHLCQRQFEYLRLRYETANIQLLLIYTKESIHRVLVTRLIHNPDKRWGNEAQGAERQAQGCVRGRSQVGI